MDRSLSLSLTYTHTHTHTHTHNAMSVLTSKQIFPQRELLPRKQLVGESYFKAENPPSALASESDLALSDCSAEIIFFFPTFSPKCLSYPQDRIIYGSACPSSHQVVPLNVVPQPWDKQSLVLCSLTQMGSGWGDSALLGGGWEGAGVGLEPRAQQDPPAVTMLPWGFWELTQRSTRGAE